MVNFLRRLANFNWTGAVLSPVMVILMEVLWVYPWLAWTGEMPAFNFQRPPLSLASLILLIGISFFTSRFFLNQKWKLRWIQFAIVLLTIFAVIHIEYSTGFTPLSGQWFVYFGRVFLDSFSRLQPLILALIASIYLSWRGIRLGHSSLQFSDIYHSFLLGLTALVLLIVVWTASLGVGSLESLASTVGLHVAGFFFFGLTALALGNLQAIRRKMLREKMAPLSSRRWVIILTVVVGGIVLVGIGIVSAFSPDFVALMSRLIGKALDLARQGLYYLFIPLNYIFAGLAYVVQFIINLIRRGQPLEPFQTPEFLNPGDLPETTAGEALPVVVTTLKWVFFAIVVAAVVFLFIKTIFRLRHVWTDTDVEEISESLWSWKGFKTDLRLFFGAMFRRWRRKKKKPVPGWYLAEDVQDMRDIREIYRYLLWEASTSGIKHRRHETPYEYARRFSQSVPDSSEQLGELTNLYVNVRYGDLKAEEEKVTRANSLWRLLRRLLRARETIGLNRDAGVSQQLKGAHP